MEELHLVPIAIPFKFSIKFFIVSKIIIIKSKKIMLKNIDFIEYVSFRNT